MSDLLSLAGAAFPADKNPMLNYPYQFHQADALHFLAEHWREFDAFHASPPCQLFSRMSNCRPGLAETYPDLITPTREMFDLIGKPYVIENVEGSTVRPDAILCGTMFRRQLYRHRVFESNMPIYAVPHPEHVVPASKAGHWKPGTIMSVSGHIAPIAHAREIMGIDWMTRDQLTESIPPDYAQFIGQQLRFQMERAA